MSATQSALDHKLTVTAFRDHAAQEKIERQLSLRELAERVRCTRGATKAALPWLKLAAFGDTPTPAGSLRHNANVLTISGIEADYDGGEIAPEDAQLYLAAANVCGIVYTSPSHSDSAPRWRVLCPTSEPLSPDRRAALVGRLNGVLGGILARESFVLSQSYFFGSIGANPEHRVLLAEGRFIDLADDLDADAVFPVRQATLLPKIVLPPNAAPDAHAEVALLAACAMFNDPAGDRHQRILAATAAAAPYVLSRHLDEADVISRIADAVIDSGREPNPGEVESALQGALNKAQPYEPNLRGAEFSVLPPLPVTEAAPPPVTEKAASASRLTIINGASLQGVTVPEPQWIVRDWLPVGYATLNYGDGGNGKTLLMEQLLTACATGSPWIGLEVQRCKTFGLFCEDHASIIHKRQSRINARLGIEFDALGDFSWACPVSDDNTLMTFSREGRPEVTPRFKDLREQVLDLGVRLVGIDTAAATFGGNENDRGQVTAFIGRCLTALALEMNGAVLLNCHPSKAGLRVGGDGTSGSTAWNGSCRSRWTLTRPAPHEDGTVNPDARILTRAKANEARTDEKVHMQWTRGYFEAGTAGPVPQEDPDALFLELLRRKTQQNVDVSNSSSTTKDRYAPKVFARGPDNGGHSKETFAAAMERLINSGAIRVEAHGRSMRLRAVESVAQP